MVRKDKTDYLIQSVSLACALMERFRSVERELSIAELSRMLLVSKNYVFRLLATLERRNFVERNPQTGSYRLGITTLQIGESCYRSKQITREAHAALGQMARLSRETSMLHVFSDGDLVCVDMVESSLPVRVLAKIGASLPLHATAAGRAMLAFGNAAVLSFCKGSGASIETGNLPDSLTLSMRNELHQIRARGYSISYGEFNPDVCAVAAPVRDHRSGVLGVVGVAGPCCRISFERLDCEIAPLVVKCALDLSASLGFCENKDAAPVAQDGVNVTLQRSASPSPPEAHEGNDSEGAPRDFDFGTCRMGHRTHEAFTAAA